MKIFIISLIILLSTMLCSFGNYNTYRSVEINKGKLIVVRENFQNICKDIYVANGNVIVLETTIVGKEVNEKYIIWGY